KRHIGRIMYSSRKSEAGRIHKLWGQAHPPSVGRSAKRIRARTVECIEVRRQGVGQVTSNSCTIVPEREEMVPTHCTVHIQSDLSFNPSDGGLFGDIKSKVSGYKVMSYLVFSEAGGRPCRITADQNIVR